MAETWCLFLLDRGASPSVPSDLDGLLSLSLWDRSTREIRTLAILRFEGEPPADLDATLAGAGWPEPEWRVRLAMDPVPPVWAREIDGTYRRTIHLAPFPAGPDAEAARSARDRFAEAWKSPTYFIMFRGDDPATGDAWVIPVSLAPRQLSKADRPYRDEFCGLLISWDMSGDDGREFHAYDRRL